MEWRLFKIGLLAFQTMWLVLVLPGHTRGMISWTRASASDACCTVDHRPVRGPDGQPTQEQQKNCAVCYYAVGLTPPPVLELSEVDDVPPEPDVDVPVEVEGAEPWHSVSLRPTLTQLFDPVLPIWTTPMPPVLELSEVDDVPPDPDDEVPVEEVG